MIESYNLENEFVAIQVNSHGAELSSFFNKERQIEHIWQGNPEFWKRHAPVLFPIVGQVQNGSYSYQGNSYELSQHGFARDMVFEINDSISEGLHFSLRYNDETLKKYPFPFQLNISYQLEGKKLTIIHSVQNLGTKIMWFSIGAHPAFNCPFEDGKSFSDYTLKFQQPENADQLLFEGGLRSGETAPYLDGNSIPLNYELFKNDAIMFEGLKSEYVDLVSSNSDYKLRFGFPGYPFFALWTPKPETPFVCLEPWFGITDQAGPQIDFSEKKGIQNIEPEEIFQCYHSIELLG